MWRGGETRREASEEAGGGGCGGGGETRREASEKAGGGCSDGSSGRANLASLTWAKIAPVTFGAA